MLLDEGVTLDGALGAAFHSQGRLCEEKFLLAASFLFFFGKDVGGVSRARK